MGICNLMKQGGKSIFPAGYKFKSVAKGDTWPGFDGTKRIPVLIKCDGGNYGNENHSVTSNLGDLWSGRQAYSPFWINVYDMFTLDKLKTMTYVSGYYVPSVYSWIEKVGGGLLTNLFRHLKHLWTGGAF